MSVSFKYAVLFAAQAGDLGEIKRLCAAGHPIPVETVASAARVGALDIVKFLHSWPHAGVVKAAASAGKLECVEWLHSMGYRDDDAIESAIANGHHACAKWLYENTIRSKL